MDDVSKSFDIIRQRRIKRLLAAELLVATPSPDVGAEPLNWLKLLDVPAWCHWPSPRIEQLILVTGALFAAPAMRLWIDAKRITAARLTVGAELFDRVMMHEPVPRVVLPFPDDADLRDSLLTAGASVLLNSLPHRCLRDRLAFLLPRSLGTLPQGIALTLSMEAQALITHSKTKEGSAS